MKVNGKHLVEIWEQVPADYYENGIESNIFQWIWHNWKWRSMQKILEQIPKEPINILDVGCSSGHITTRLSKLFPKSKISAIDAYKPAIDLAKKIHPKINFLIGDAHKLLFDDQSFDLITCTETLEHLEDPKKAIAQIKRCLKNNGWLLVGQDTDSILFKLVWFVWTKTHGKVWKDSHIHPLNASSLEKAIIKNGFKIKIKKYSQVGLEVFFLAQKR